MCVYCDKLKNVENGTKKASVLKENTNELIGFREIVEIVVDKDKFGNENIFIHHEATENGLWKNVSFDVAYCPMCGRKL